MPASSPPPQTGTAVVIKELLRFFKGARAIGIRRTDCQAWEVKRGKKLKPSTSSSCLLTPACT
ncbi:MAG: hypothetical protein ACPGSB_01775 [Opitutales bacterium]